MAEWTLQAVEKEEKAKSIMSQLSLKAKDLFTLLSASD
jgi:hypothetical protein